jgi:hypothetical protein
MAFHCSVKQIFHEQHAASISAGVMLAIIAILLEILNYMQAHI